MFENNLKAMKVFSQQQETQKEQQKQYWDLLNYQKHVLFNFLNQRQKSTLKKSPANKKLRKLTKFFSPKTFFISKGNG